MEIRKELQDFLNDEDVLNLIADHDWAKLFSMQKLSRRTINCSQLHSVLLNSGIASTQEILDILGYVPAGFFQDFRSLENIRLSNNITSIGNYAFDRCKNLTNITIPDSVTSIGDYAFFDCSSLTSITIPNSVTRIGKDAFWGCDLKTIYFNGTKDQWKQVKKTRGWKGDNTQVKIIFKG